MDPTVVLANVSPAKIEVEQFSQLWQDALTRYAELTHIDLSSPTAPDLIRCDTAESLLAILDERQRKFEHYRQKSEAIRNVVKPVVNLVENFLDLISGGASFVTSLSLSTR